MPLIPDFRQLAVSDLHSLQPYQPGKPIEALARELGLTNILKLASNENPLGISPKARIALTTPLETLELYPDGSGYNLKQAIAHKFGIQAAQITLGNGSTDVLDMIARAYLGKIRSVVLSQYAFAVYRIASSLVGATLRIADANPPEHPTMPYGHNIDNLLAQVDTQTRVVFIANPNNPTGTWLRKDELHRLLQQIPNDVLVVIDEAYTEYVQDTDFPNSLEWLEAFPNLVITRTFSKIYGLAGLRVGYAVSHPAVADMLNRVRQACNVNTLALAAAEAALDDDAFIQDSVTTNAAGLQQWFDACAKHGWKYIPTVGNFITVDCERPATPVYESLLREGIIVRPMSAYQLPQHLRITIGTETQNNRCIEALRNLLFT
jgi:histidinol-phosphate aminotransferase